MMGGLLDLVGLLAMGFVIAVAARECWLVSKEEMREDS